MDTFLQRDQGLVVLFAFIIAAGLLTLVGLSLLAYRRRQRFVSLGSRFRKAADPEKSHAWPQWMQDIIEANVQKSMAISTQIRAAHSEGRIRRRPTAAAPVPVPTIAPIPQILESEL